MGSHQCQAATQQLQGHSALSGRLFQAWGVQPAELHRQSLYHPEVPLTVWSIHATAIHSDTNKLCNISPHVCTARQRRGTVSTRETPTDCYQARVRCQVSCQHCVPKTQQVRPLAVELPCQLSVCTVCSACDHGLCGPLSASVHITTLIRMCETHPTQPGLHKLVESLMDARHMARSPA